MVLVSMVFSVFVRWSSVKLNAVFSVITYVPFSLYTVNGVVLVVLTPGGTYRNSEGLSAR